MAGGKETPRQKMIGMMYLVLTALLALNVASTILDAFVAIEENIQVANENEYQRGREKVEELEEVTEDETQPDMQKKAKMLMETIRRIDKITAERVQEIDRLKLEILDACGEDTKNIGGKESIILAKYPHDPLKPMRMKLDYVLGKDKYDEPMNILIGDDITAPKGRGMELWKHYNDFRKQLTELLASSSSADNQRFFFKDPEINQYKDLKDLYAKMDKAIKASNVAPDDKEAIKKIYSSLTKQERSEVHEIKNVHWIGKTFDHSPSVAALASLSSLQKEILTARADAVALIRSRVTGGEFSFNKIMPLAYGPEVINQGEEAEIEVLMAAYDSDRRPQVKFNGSDLSSDKIRDGKGHIQVRGSGSEMKLSGTITILTKSGIPKTLPWEKTIRVMQPSGTVSLPQMNVMYRSYDNIVQGVASGYEETILQGGNGLQLTRSGNQYIGRITGTSRDVTVTISGRNKNNGKSQQLGVFKFRVSNLPKPMAFLGTIENGAKATPVDIKAVRQLFVRYGSEIPLNVTFAVKSWDLTVSGPGVYKTEGGNGAVLSTQAKNLLNQVKPGTTVSLTVQFKGPIGGFASSAITVK